jgi:inhibitor of cysteine peptidase
MQYIRFSVRIIVVLALVLLTVGPAAQAIYAQDAATPIVLDDAGFGLAQMEALAAQGQAAFTLDLKAGDRVTMDLQGASDALQVTEFAAPYGPLVMAGVPEAFNYLVWAPEDGVYTVVVENQGDAAAGFVLRVVVTPAPLPAKKILTADANGQTIPVTLDEPFQVALDVNAGDGYGWTLDALDAAVLAEAADAVTVPLSTMPGAMSQQILTFQGVAPGATTLAFTNARAGGATVADTYTVTIEVMAADAALGEQLVSQFFDTLMTGDKEQLAAMLAPAFQLLRSSGELFDATSYPAVAPVYEDYVLDNLNVTRDGDLLVATYTVQTDATLDGVVADFSAPAARLTVFQQIDGVWKLVAHANFAPPAIGDADTAAALQLLPASQITVTDADNGSTVQVAAGGKVEVALPGNPTTGYIWQVTANDESILLPLSYEFVPDSAAAGAGGVERFGFHVMAPGMVSLTFANSRPWETDVEPAQTFAVTVDAVNEWSGDGAMITAGMEENGQTVAIMPGAVLLVALEGAPDGEWMLVQSDPMIVQPLGGWMDYPGESDPTLARFHRYFLGVAGGTTDLRFEFMNADGATTDADYALTVTVPPLEPGSSGAVAVTEADAGGESALVTGDTLVVRLPGNPTTGYDWRVVSTNDALLPAAGDPVYAASSDLTGAGGVYTFRFLAKAAGEAAVQIGEFAPGADDPDKTLDFNATIVDPAPLTGNTVTATADDAGKAIALAAGDWLAVELESNPSTGYLWLVTANDGAVLRLLPESGYTATSDMPGAPGMQHFAFRALAPGAVALAISLFPPGDDTPEQVVEYAVAVK